MQHFGDLRNVIVWAISDRGRQWPLGVVSSVLGSATSAYTASAGDEQCDFANEIAAASWIAMRSPVYPDFVCVGRVFTPDYQDWLRTQPHEPRQRLHPAH